MEKYYSEMGFIYVPDIKIRFGKEDSIQGLWKQIIAIDDVQKRHKCIDNLLELMELNKEANGFFGRDAEVDCGNQHGFLLDDKNLYYSFFDNLRCLNMQNIDGKVSNGSIINQAIKTTINDYAGGNKTNRDLRFALTKPITEDDKRIFPSISKQKGQNCFYCTEYASISHNLWLLTGATSYFCWTNSDNFGSDNPEYKNDAHHFTIVEYDNKYKLYDLAMKNFCQLENDCIDKLLSGQGLTIGEGKYVSNPGVYAQNLSLSLDPHK